MKEKTRTIISAALLLCLSLGSVMTSAMAEPVNKEIRVLLVYNPESLKQSPYILDAYESVLQEEGIPYETMDVSKLAGTRPADLFKTVPAVIFPDAILQNAPEQMAAWTRNYLALGGNAAVIYDAGTKDKNGNYLGKAVFADAIGLNYIIYGSKGAEAYASGKIQFISKEAVDFFQIPPGKTINQTLAGYGYGELTYPFARIERLENFSDSSAHAYGITKEGEKTPVVVLGDYAKGKTLYVNLPLGYLKAFGDDLPLRSALRTFLLEVVQIPHVMSVAKGTGGLVINWHVDSVVEYDTLPVMKKLGLLRKGINASIHITAGDFLNDPGDGKGFEACKMGKSLTRMLSEYGAIGSHGGWAHNWFAANITRGAFKEKEIQEYIDRNNKCLESVLGGKIIEYSAPVGVHPQPEATLALENLGMIAYYYTGDMGSPPNRVFAKGRKVSDKVIAFPLVPFGRSASLYEVHTLDKKTDAEVSEWLAGILDYVARNRTVRLVYSHPRDLGYYPEPVREFLDKAEVMQGKNVLLIQPMGDIAKFMLRFFKTSYSFSEHGPDLAIALKNAETLKDITVAIPRKTYGKPDWDPKYVQEDDKYYYVTVGEVNETEKTILAPRH